jgi:hypothetical protein
MYTMPQYLSATVGISDELEGLTLGTLKPCDMIYVRTLNSDYEIFLLDPERGRVLVNGGKYIAGPMEATVSGSTFGGSMLKVGWLCEGLRMELIVNGQSIVTSPVQKLRVKHVASLRAI